MKAKYTWVVMPVSSAGDKTEIDARIGPTGQGEMESFDVVVRKGAEFRLLDAVGNERYIGHIIGDYEGPEPLDDLGRGVGCTDIEYTEGRSSSAEGPGPLQSR